MCKINIEKALINSALSNTFLLRGQSIRNDNDIKIAVTSLFWRITFSIMHTKVIAFLH